MFRRASSLVIIFSLLFFCNSGFAWTVDGDRVWQNDSNCYISVEPHTLGSSGYSVVTFKSHTFTGNVDVCYGFNTTEAVPRYPSWKDHWENTTTNHQAYFYNVTDIQTYTGSEFDYGNAYNTYHRTVTYHNLIDWNESTNTTTYELKTVNISFDSYDQSETNYTIYWHTDHSEWITWTPIPPSRYNSITYDFQGFDKWYYATDLSITAGTEYQTRIWLDMPVSLEGSSGKYYFAIKPSSETIGQAIANGHFYYIDPWWDSSWSKRKQVNVSHVNATGETLYNFPAHINITDEPEMQADYDDVMFVDFNDTVMDFELENYTSTHAIYWVNITNLPTTGRSFWMYYGNDAATSQEDPEGVWDNDTQMVHHFQDLNDSTKYGNDVTNYGSTYNSTWLMDGERDFDGVDDYVDISSVSLGTQSTITFIGKFNSGTQNMICGDGTANTYNFYMTSGGVGLMYFKIGGFYTTHSIPALQYVNYEEYVWVRNNTSSKLYKNGNLLNENIKSEWNGLSHQVSEIGRGYGSNSFNHNGSITEIRMSSTIRSADWINESYQLVTNQSTFVTWGATEEQEIGDYIPPTPITLQNTTSQGWINYTWLPGSGNITNSYNVSVNAAWTNTSSNFSNNNVGVGNWANITIYAFNSSGNGSLSLLEINDSVFALDHSPALPANLTYTTEGYWVNYTWDVGTGGNSTTDLFNVSVNGTWYNNSNQTWRNTTVSMCNWVNISVWAYNTTYNRLSISAASDQQKVDCDYTNELLYNEIQDLKEENRMIDEAIRAVLGVFVPLFILMILCVFYSFVRIDLDNYTHILTAFIGGILGVLLGFQTFTLDTGSVLSIGWAGGFLCVFGGIMIVYAILLTISVIVEATEELPQMHR